jgi:sarcosine oxidase subunit alpha
MATTAGDVTVIVNGQRVRVPSGTSAAAAVAMAGVSAYRVSVTGAPRGPLCGMGTCFECRATVDGVPNVRTCRTVCREGMEICTDGA